MFQKPWLMRYWVCFHKLDQSPKLVRLQQYRCEKCWFAHDSIYIYIHISLHAYICMSIVFKRKNWTSKCLARTHTYGKACICMYACKYTCMYIYISIYIYILTYVTLLQLRWKADISVLICRPVFGCTRIWLFGRNLPPVVFKHLAAQKRLQIHVVDTFSWNQ